MVILSDVYCHFVCLHLLTWMLNLQFFVMYNMCAYHGVSRVSAQNGLSMAGMDTYPGFNAYSCIQTASLTLRHLVHGCLYTMGVCAYPECYSVLVI